MTQQHKKPLIVQVIQHHSPKSTRLQGLSKVIRITQQRRLRLLNAYEIRFIRGLQDQSPWRKAGRQELLTARESLARETWGDRRSLLRSPLNPRKGAAGD